VYKAHYQQAHAQERAEYQREWRKRRAELMKR
jgi:hypothetical protein